MQNLTKAQMTFLFWLIVGSILLITITIVYKIFSSPHQKTIPQVQETLSVLQDKIDQSKEQVLVEKLKIKYDADTAKKDLDNVLAIKDGMERRKQLAALLNK